MRNNITDAVVLSGRCHERESVPYKALDGFIDGLSRYLRALPAADTAAAIPRNAALLLRVFPILGRVEEISIAPRLHLDIADGHVLRNRAFAALRELLYRCAERRPMLIWIDDFQWTDGDSLIALRALVRSDEAPRALLVLSSRPIRSDDSDDESAQLMLAEIVEAVTPERVRLGPLPSVSATELAQVLLERAGRRGPEIAAHIASEAGGHPLYIAELARHAVESKQGASDQLRLSDAITSRVAKLPATTRWVLDLVAVAGTPLSRETLQAAARLDTASFRKHTAMLRVAHLVRTDGSRNEDPMEPYHDHVRQAVLAAQEPSRRRECHARLAAALQSASGSGVPPEIVLVHLEGAGQSADAARFAEAAAERADRALSFDLAARLYATGLRLGEHDLGTRRALLVRLGQATANAGHRAEAAQVFLEAVDGASSAEALDLQRQAAESLLVSGHLDEGSAYQVRHFRLALKAGEPTRLATSFAHEAVLVSLRGRSGGSARARALASRGRELSEQHKSSLARGWVNAGTGMSYYQVGAFADALASWEDAQAFWSPLPGLHFEKATVRLYQNWAFFYLGRWADLCRDVRVQLQLARERGDLYSATNFVTGLPNTVWLVHDQSRRAARLVQEHAERWSHRGFHLQHYWGVFALAQASLYDLAPAAAWESLDAEWAALRRSLLLRVSMVRIEAYDLRARCALALATRLPPGDSRRRVLIREARRCTRKVRRSKLDFATALDLLVHAGLAFIDGQGDDSVALLREALPAFERADMAAHAEIARWRLGELVGGDEGLSLMRQAKEWMTEQEVVKPERMVEVIAPGFQELG